MSWKQGHESYTENIKVKISERYKPPPRINIAMTYAQRLFLNKQTQDNIPNYEFKLEQKVLENMREWKSVKLSTIQERKLRLEQAREEIKKKETEHLEQEQLDEVEIKTVHETVTTTSTNNNNFIATPTNITFSAGINQNYRNYSTNNSILVPTQASSNYSTILTPIPLQSYGNQQYCKPNDKSPFNISDFENDTSSPFDNMELKSINDMEELAQVLNRGENSYKTNTHTYPNYGVQPTPSHMQPTYSNYLTNQFSYNIPHPVSYVPCSSTDYSHTNGYYYSQNQSLHPQYFYSKPSTIDYYTTSIQSSKPVETKTSNCKSVPDIVKALEDELENTRIGTSAPKESFIRTSISSQTNRPKSTDAVYPKAKIKAKEMDDPFDSLTMSQQDLCRSISSMGFPLSRVARTFKIFGGDQKKMVEHLLALSDLLDLGFPESDVSNALVQCDNDRDKALDKLIS